jgi:hypothetical protein
MREIKLKALEIDTDYLVFTGYSWSPSGFDIGNYNLAGQLISQSNGEDLLKLKGVKIFELPIVD